MSEENVEIVLGALHRFEAEDFEWGEETVHPDAVLSAPTGWPEPGPFEGLEAIKEQSRRLASEMEEHRFKDLKVVADRDDWVVVTFIWDVRGEGSGVTIASKMAAAFHLTDGKFKEMHYRWTREKALEAAGLSE